MKRFLILLLSLPVFAVAQPPECKINRETDPFTKEVRLSTGFVQLQGGSVTIDADQREIDIMFSINGTDKCFDNNSTAWIFFEGVKTKLTSRNAGTMNCEGLFHFIFKNSTAVPTILQKLMSQKTDYLVFTGNNKVESIVKIREDDRERLMQIVTCLVNEAKTLLK